MIVVLDTATISLSLVPYNRLIMNFYIFQNDEAKGPYTIGQLRSMVSVRASPH